VICDKCGNPILKDDKSITQDDKIIHDYCKYDD